MMGDWWCPTCKAYVSGESVTFDELHVVCGEKVGTHPLDRLAAQVPEVALLLDYLSPDIQSALTAVAEYVDELLDKLDAKDEQVDDLVAVRVPQLQRAEQAEAVVEALKARIDAEHADYVKLWRKAEQAEAELAALKARRCETCRNWKFKVSGDVYCPKLRLGWVPEDFACSHWAAKDTP